MEARRLFSRVEDPIAAEGIYLGFRIAVEMHSGWTAGLADGMAAIYQSPTPSYIGDLPVIGVAMSAAGIGDREQARAAYDRMAPADGWNPPQFVWLDLYATRVYLAARLDVRGDLPPLLEALDPYRGVHVAGGGGIVNYIGPVELWLGVGAAAIERWDDADRDLATAADQARAAGAPSFAVHADVERAEALLGRGGSGDARLARTLLDRTRPIAVRLGMPEFLQRIDAALARLAADGPLSPRELEVAALVAEGRTNKEIAAELYLSERTAQNHVQHILTKLGFDNRTQVAAWYPRPLVERQRHGLADRTITSTPERDPVDHERRERVGPDDAERGPHREPAADPGGDDPPDERGDEVRRDAALAHDVDPGEHDGAGGDRHAHQERDAGGRVAVEVADAPDGHGDARPRDAGLQGQRLAGAHGEGILQPVLVDGSVTGEPVGPVEHQAEHDQHQTDEPDSAGLLRDEIGEQGSGDGRGYG